MSPALISPAIVITAIVAGGLGALIRFLVSAAYARGSRADSFGWAVLLVNVVGSALGGIALGLARNAGIDEGLQFIILTGVCGGLTTFSTFSVESMQLVNRGRWVTAILSVVANLALGFGACVLGYLLAL